MYQDALERPKQEVLSADLAGIAESANESHRKCIEAARESVMHAVGAGQALHRLRESCANGEWTKAVNDLCDFSISTAYVYMQIALHKDRLPDCIEGPGQARAYLDSIGATSAYKTELRRGPRSDETRSLVLALADTGTPLRQIERETGVSRATVRRWLDPEADKRWRERKKSLKRRRQMAEEALRRDALARKAKERGDSVGKAYSLSRGLEQALQAAIDKSADPELRARLAEAQRGMLMVDSALVSAIGLS